MRQQTYHRWLAVARLLLLGGMGGATVWNLVSLWLSLSGMAWGLGLVTLLLPGPLLWLGAMAGPLVWASLERQRSQCYRLFYDAPPDWTDERARRALLNLARGSGLDIIWARDGQDSLGCWLAVDTYGTVLGRLVRDVFPTGTLEADAFPTPGNGVVILQASSGLPAPLDLCRQEGITGLFYRYRSEHTATLALWGTQAVQVAVRLTTPNHLLPGQGNKLLRPRFVGDNPWPQLPPFPSSQENPGLSAVSQLQRLAPALRVDHTRQALVVGRDAEGQHVGFPLPDLTGLQPLHILGRSAETMLVNLVQQTMNAGLPVMVLDGRGTATATLARQLLREMASGRVLLGDVERPAQSRFRLNPLWLPQERTWWPHILSSLWPAWLRELGVTPGGLGRLAYQHTQVAVILTALAVAEQGQQLDVPGLRELLETPGFLRRIETGAFGQQIVGDEVWAWWQNEGRATSSLDAQMRLAHLRDRLGALLALPEYSVLWRAPYLDLARLLAGEISLFWRLPDPRRRLRAYVTSQLLALTTLLTLWPEEQPPLVIFIHELAVAEAWLKRLATFTGARLVLASERLGGPLPVEPSARLLSCLERVDAEQMQASLPGVRAMDLRRLPPGRALWQQGEALVTVDLIEPG